MGFNIVNDRDEIVGWTADEFIPPTGQRLVADNAQDVQLDITAHRNAKIQAVQEQVRRLIDDSSWRTQRAEERDLLGIAGETPQQVLAYREAIRQAGDRAERELAILDSVDGINAYAFEIRESDYPVIAHLTHLQFLRRFTADERTAITKLRAKQPQINDYFTLLELAKFVNPYDPDVILGVNMLEQSGVIAKGRAGQILNGENV